MLLKAIRIIARIIHKNSISVFNTNLFLYIESNLFFQFAGKTFAFHFCVDFSFVILYDFMRTFSLIVRRPCRSPPEKTAPFSLICDFDFSLRKNAFSDFILCQKLDDVQVRGRVRFAKVFFDPIRGPSMCFAPIPLYLRLRVSRVYI